MTKRAALYLRVSRDTQTIDNQLLRLRQVAESRGWEIVATFQDEGVSRTKKRDQRPGLDEALTAATRKRFDVLMVWAIDRLGGSLADLIASVQTLEAVGAGLYIDQQNIDTTTPTGKLVFHFFGALAEWEISMMKARIHAGLDRARAQGKRPGPRLDAAKVEHARSLLAGGMGVLKAAKTAGIGTSTVQGLKAAMVQDHGVDASLA